MRDFELPKRAFIPRGVSSSVDTQQAGGVNMTAKNFKIKTNDPVGARLPRPGQGNPAPTTIDYLTFTITTLEDISPQEVRRMLAS